MASPTPATNVATELNRTVLENLTIFPAPGLPGTRLASGLAGAIGCDYRPLRHQLVFVEFGGRLSRLNLVPSSTILSQGVATIPGTFLFDFETGAVPAPGAPITPPYDVWWEQIDATQRQMVPMNGAQIVRLGPVSFGAVSAAELLGLPYGAAPIDGSVGAANRLTDGTVFAVRTAGGHYAKAQVLDYGYNLKIRWVTYQVSPVYEVLGTGYTQPEDVKVSADETHAYVTERSGALLRVDLANADRAFATVVASGMTAPHQIHLDETHNQAFVVQYAAAGRLTRIDLTTGARTNLAAALERPVGLVMSADLQFAYVTEQTAGPDQGRLSRIQLGTGHRQVLVTGLTAPFFLTWADPAQSALLLAERDPANRVTRVNLADTPVTATHVVTGVPFRPSSVAVTSPTELLVCSDQEITRYELSASVYVPTGPMLLGIGHVPADRISRSSPVDPVADGYADTTVDPGYFFQVKDAPFGGTLAVMFNHDRAYDEGARYYKLLVDGVEPRQAFTDYRWSTPLNRFVAQAVNPSASGYYRVRPPSELWYNHWLGYMLATLGLANGIHTVVIRLYSAQNAASEIGSGAAPGRSVVLQIDNSAPMAAIDQVLHDGAVVGTCAIVDSGTDEFTFRVTASDAEGHLAGWSLAALWGDNRSALVASDTYAAHAGPTRKWNGISGTVVPAAPWHATVAGDPTSRRCAHTFRLRASSRVIDGWTHLHFADYYKSITLMLP